MVASRRRRVVSSSIETFCREATVAAERKTDVMTTMISSISATVTSISTRVRPRRRRFTDGGWARIGGSRFGPVRVGTTAVAFDRSVLGPAVHERLLEDVHDRGHVQGGVD